MWDFSALTRYPALRGGLYHWTSREGLIMSSLNKGSFSLPFQSEYHFIPLSYCTSKDFQFDVKWQWWKSTSSLKGKASSVLTLSMMSAAGFSVDVFYQVEEVAPLFLICWEFLCSMNACWILSNAFFGSTDKMLCFFFFSLLMQWITLIHFQLLNQSMHTGINASWSRC